MQTTADLLRAAKAEIADETKWTQYTLARDSNGNALEIACDPGAVCFCTFGAIMKVSGYNVEQAYWNHSIPALDETKRLHMLVQAVENLREYAKKEMIGDTNDSSTHPQVMEWFDKAIERAVQREAEYG